MKLNSKGMTLTEVIAALIILSIVMIFLFNILSDLRYEDYLSLSRNEDSINRANLINIIENDFISKDLYRVSSCEDGNNICLLLDFKKSNQKKLIVAETYVAYGSENALEKWDLQNGKYDLQSFSYCLKTSSYDENLSDLTNMQYSEYFFLRIKVPVIDIIDNGRKADLDLIYMNKSINHQFPYSISVRGSTYTCV